MRIAQIMLGKGFGGAERSFVDLSLALAARGHHILAIGEARGAALPVLKDVNGITCFGLTCMGSWDRWAGYRIQRALADFAPDLVQAHLARAALLGGRAARALGLPALAKTHNLVDLRYYRYLNMLVPTTNAQAEYLLQHGIPRHTQTLIPNFSAIVPVDEVMDAAPARHVVKTLGRFVTKKGFDLLIDATAAVLQTGRDIKLVIAGDGPERAALAAQITDRNLQAHVRLEPWVSDVRAFLADAGLFVLPSRDEPFGIVLLEAMACGVPIIATPTQGPLEILTAETALLLEEISAESIAASLIAALDAPQAMHARARQALEVFRACYSPEVVVAQYVALYQRMLSEQGFRA
jgi:glycosyltransferase involved in cell wall biosynthesis